VCAARVFGRGALPAYRIDVKNQAAHLAQKRAPHILQPVMRAVEAVNVQVNHLQEAAREKLRVEELSPASDQLVLYALVAVERLQFDALREFGAAEIIFVAGGSCPELLIR